MGNKKDPNQLFKFGVLIVVLLVLLFAAHEMGANKTKNTRSNQSAKVQKTDVDLDKKPESFPENIPLEAGANITQNLNATTPTGQFQATRVFETKKSLTENLTIYNEFLKSAGWTTNSTIDTPNHKVVIASLGKKSFQISIDQNKTTQIKTVSISYIENQ